MTFSSQAVAIEYLHLAVWDHVERLRGDGIQADDPVGLKFTIPLLGGFSLSLSLRPNIWNEYNRQIETALIFGGDIFYDYSLGYTDVRQFDSYEKLVAEIRRLKDIKEFPVPEKESSLWDSSDDSFSYDSSFSGDESHKNASAEE